MPTYDYHCSACAYRFEVFEGMSAEGTRTCPKCGRGKARRLLSTGSGFIFKGAGFYTTDYKRANTKAENPKLAEKKQPAASSA